MFESTIRDLLEEMLDEYDTLDETYENEKFEQWVLKHTDKMVKTVKEQVLSALV